MIYELMAQPKFDRIVPLEEVAKNRYYADLADLAVIFNNDIVAIDDDWYWKPNVLISWIKRYGSYRQFHGDTPEMGSGRGQLSLDDLFDDLQKNCFSVEEWVKFNMQIGYRLSGFCEIVDGSAEDISQCKNNLMFADETLLSYLLRVHEGKVLKL